METRLLRYSMQLAAEKEQQGSEPKSQFVFLYNQRGKLNVFLS